MHDRRCQNAEVPPHRDVPPFEQKATGYEKGWRGRLHHRIADRTALVAISAVAAPERVLDVGCGTGYLLRMLARQWPRATELAGIDPAPAMIEAAAALAVDHRLEFSIGAAEQLPFSDGFFNLVVSTTSFYHWPDQQAGLRECARVLVPGGQLVLVDRFSPWLIPTLTGGRREAARTRGRADKLITTAGFHSIAWHDLYAFIIKAVTATT
jgi:ubiquinone/menaquinone biosynthesis C-methylase UbiE